MKKILTIPELKYAEVHSVRWIGMERAVKVLYHTYPALFSTLSHQAANGDSTAKGLYYKITQYKFIALIHLMMGILPFVGKLSCVFQTVNLDFSKVKPMVESTCEALSDLVKCEGVFVEKLNCAVVKENDKVVTKGQISDKSSACVSNDILENFDFDGFSNDSGNDVASDESENVNQVELKYYTQLKNMISSVIKKYVDRIVGNLQDRFQDSGLVDDMKVLVPMNIVSESENIVKNGEEQINSLANHFSLQISVNVDDCHSEYRQYTHLGLGMNE